MHDVLSGADVRQVATTRCNMCELHCQYLVSITPHATAADNHSSVVWTCYMSTAVQHFKQVLGLAYCIMHVAALDIHLICLASNPNSIGLLPAAVCSVCMGLHA